MFKTTKIALDFILFCSLLAIIAVFSGCPSTGSSGGGVETLLYEEDFERYAGGWKPRGGASISVVTGKGHSGDKSLYITNRGKTWHGAILPLTILKSGQSYRISVWVMFDDDSAPSQGVNISIQQNVDGQGETYNTIGAERVPKGVWTYIEGEYDVPRSRYEMATALYFEGRYKADENTEPSDLFSFYVDDITITRLPPAPPPAIEKDIPDLFESFKDDFPLGAALENGNMLSSGSRDYGLLRHFNVYVYGNSMKQNALQPSEGRFNWTQGDALVDYAQKNKKLVRGHTLIWHQQVPNWWFQGSGPNGMATKEQLYARMKNHIQTVVGHYKGKINTWDVVNEALGEDGSLRDSRYYQIVGSYEYIANAFRWAHEADPDALLCLNDYSIEAPSAKQDGFVKLLDNLLAEGVPVHVAGIQGHISTAWPTVSDMRQAIRRFAALGLKVQITELDISIYADSGEAKKRADREILLAQATKFRALFEMFREEARAGNLDMVVVWGLSDLDTWLNNYPVPGRTDYPLFFGKDLRAKPAYWGLVDPSRLPIQVKRIDATRADKALSGIKDTAWDMVSPRAITDKQGKNNYGWFKVMWDDKQIYTLLHTDKKDKSGKVRFFIEPENLKQETLAASAYNKEFSLSEAADDGTGLSMLIAMPFNGRIDMRVGYDLRLEYGKDIYSWNDYDNSQETASANYGTINLRTLPKWITTARRGTVDLSTRATREIDPAWNAATPVKMTIKTMGHTEEGSQFRAMWDDNYLYVLTEVIDPSLDNRSSIVHEQDTVEVFLDQNNGKTSTYEMDDGQYRVSFSNFVSFNGGDTGKFKSRSMVVPGSGYRVEMALPLYAIKPAAGTIMGFDVQINDATNGSRSGIRNWASDTNMGYQTTEDYGLIVLR
jgi:endo-1,4-beta-xylanase